MSSDRGVPLGSSAEPMMSQVPSMDEIPALWMDDGSLTDIYVHDTSPEDWQSLLNRVRSLDASYAFDGLDADLPSAVDIFNNRSGSHLLRFQVQGVLLHCHFFIAEEIEIDVRPRDVRSAEQHAGVLAFVAELATTLGKPASITPENSPETPFVVFRPDSGWSIPA